MFSHVTIGARDMAALTAFYDAILRPLGHVRAADHGHDGWQAWGPPGAPPRFWVGPPFDGRPPSSGNGWMAAFEAPSRAAVDAWHAALLAAGGSDQGAPGRRPHYHPDFYGAYGRDPEGNKLCAACHAPG
jgi:catechol 2,3-dioxygenase-like lactoylglutathione lyase family enzyme